MLRFLFFFLEKTFVLHFVFFLERTFVLLFFFFGKAFRVTFFLERIFVLLYFFGKDFRTTFFFWKGLSVDGSRPSSRQGCLYCDEPASPLIIFLRDEGFFRRHVPEASFFSIFTFIATNSLFVATRVMLISTNQ